MLNDIVDGVARSIEGTARQAGSVFDPSIRLGVTGLSRAGKTVFITSLIANLMDR
ncbi:MAG: YcjX family protein, partial [Litoreibacter sp.]|nr:YcjX family protein [Litoreibacter sp.]